ncbi:MAG: glycosyltransferase, partial [Bacteroidales bacterium]|nr:glycosyltransferase [Bacteroidales bacterium]
MKVLFISSGNIHQINPIIKNQGESLKRAGIDLEFFTIRGKGLFGYLKNVLPLRRKIIIGNYDLVHAHYSLSAITASLTLKRPLVVSLMGSDVYASGAILRLIRLLSKRWWNANIVKSQEMKEKLRLPGALVIPNGVNTDLFKPMMKTEALAKLEWEHDKKHILFPANKEREVKNFGLAEKSVKMLDDPDVHIHSLENVPNCRMPLYYNAADVVLMTSHWEGSPNAIKEAMACNAPIVATDVGDIKSNLEGVDNCHVTDADPVP